MAAVSMAIWKECLWAELFDDEFGDGRPVSILHVDDALFARASVRGGLSMSDAEARRAFLGAFPDRLRVQRWLVGSENPGEATLPLLVLCCLAASEAADSDDNDYRGRMRDMMGWGDRIINCEALPRLWARLVALTGKRAERAPTRPLVLPNPRFRTQIGHAIELTFPSRNDTRRLTQELAGETFDLDSPRAVLAWLAPLIAKRRFSSTFEQTYCNFRDAWLEAERSLADHRFWSGWKLATQGFRPKGEEVAFEIASDEWGIRHIIDPRDETAIDLEAALRARALPGALIAAATGSHAISLVEGEWGRLRWIGPDRGRAPMAALIRQRAFASRYESLKCSRVSGAEGWGLSFDVAGVFGDRSVGVDRDRLIDLTPIGCARVDGGVLARPALPFSIEASGIVANVFVAGDLAEKLSLERVDAKTWRVKPREPLTGELRVIAEPRSGGASFERGLRLRRAILAPSFRSVVPERLFDGDPPPAPDWPTTDVAMDFERELAEPGANVTAPALFDLIEFLAVRTVPLPLGGFGDVVRAAIGGEGVILWDVIQALRDAGIVKVLDVRGWRGRVVLARAPRGAITRTPDGWALAFEGCLHETWLARLTAAADRHGLEVELRAGVGAWAPPTPVVVAGDVDALRDIATMIDTPVGFLVPNLMAVQALTMAQPLSKTEARTTRRDVRLDGSHAPLAFLDTERANVTPVWEVRRGEAATFWRNRDDAVINAYIAARGRPFTRVGARWATRDARLPAHVARWLRLSLGVAAGPMTGAGYAYARDTAADLELARLSPALFGRLEALDAETNAPLTRRWRSLAVATSAGPRVRPLWIAAHSAREGNAS